MSSNNPNQNNVIPLPNTQQSTTASTTSKVSPDQQLANLTKDFKLYKDIKEVTYIEIIDYDQGFREINKRIIRIRSGEFKEYMADLMYRNYYKFPQKNILESLILTLVYKAKLHGTLIEVFNRIGIDKNDNIYIDLSNANKEVIKINKAGWSFSKQPVIFTKYNHMSQLPVPQQGGDLKDLLYFIPVKSKHDQCLLLCWLVASMIPDIERCFLLLEGPPGSKKSAIAKRLKELIDPMNGNALTLTTKDNEVAQQLGQHCVPYFDNITSITKAISDIFCGCFTGNTFSKKALYTDDGSFIFKMTGNIIFTSLKLEKPRPDFLERTFKVKTIRQPGYKSQRKLLKKYEALAPQLFGALLDTLVAVLNKVDQIPEPDKYRTVDFDHYCAATAEVLGYGEKMYWEARNHVEEIKTKGMTHSFPVLQALHTFLVNKDGRWTGCMNELLFLMKSISENPDQLPRAANKLSLALDKLEPELQTAGITISGPYHGKCNIYEITLSGFSNNNAVSPPPQKQSTTDEALDEVISEHMTQVSDDNVLQAGTSNNVNQSVSNTDDAQFVKDIIDDISGIEIPPEPKRKSKSPSHLDQAVSDLFDNMGAAHEVKGGQNPFLVDDEPEDSQ